MDLQSYLKTHKKLVEESLDRLLPQPEQSPQRLNQAVRYSLLGGGKRLRPILVLSAARAVGGNVEQLLPFACAMECIHTYSLIHDDLPAMDNDDMRRGRATCHKQFDEATAILAGDALLTFAFQLACQPIKGIADTEILAVVRQMAVDAGIFGMVGGQMMDMLAENRSVNLEELQKIHRWKTGALIRSSCEAGARLGGGNPQQVEALRRYGEAIGLAFQITDDLLDVTGDSLALGKNTGQDLIHTKSTYPSLMGLEKAREKAHDQMNLAISHLTPLPDSADPLRDLARFITERTY